MGKTEQKYRTVKGRLLFFGNTAPFSWLLPLWEGLTSMGENHSSNGATRDQVIGVSRHLTQLKDISSASKTQHSSSPPFVGGSTHLQVRGAVQQLSHKRSCLLSNQAEQADRIIKGGILRDRSLAQFSWLHPLMTGQLTSMGGELFSDGTTPDQVFSTIRQSRQSRYVG